MGEACGYTNGDISSPYTCPPGYSCAYETRLGLYGCTNALSRSLSNNCVDAGSPSQLPGTLSCNDASRYCATKTLTYTPEIPLSQYYCATQPGETIILLYTATNEPQSGSTPASSIPVSTTASPGNTVSLDSLSSSTSDSSVGSNPTSRSRSTFTTGSLLPSTLNSDTVSDTMFQSGTMPNIQSSPSSTPSLSDNFSTNNQFSSTTEGGSSSLTTSISNSYLSTTSQSRSVSSSASSTSPTSTSNDNSNNNHGLSTDKIVGIVVGIFVAVGVVSTIFYAYRNDKFTLRGLMETIRYNRRQENQTTQQQQPQPQPSGNTHGAVHNQGNVYYGDNSGNIHYHN